jgi:hypothetical protein
MSVVFKSIHCLEVEYITWIETSNKAEPRGPGIYQSGPQSQEVAQLQSSLRRDLIMVRLSHGWC